MKKIEINKKFENLKIKIRNKKDKIWEKKF